MIIWNNKKFKYENKPISKQKIHNYMWDEIEIQDEIQIKDIFEIIKLNPQFWQIVTGINSLPEFLKEYQKIKNKKLKDPWINEVHFSWFTESWKMKKRKMKLLGKIYNLKKSHDFSITFNATGYKNDSQARCISMVNLEEIINATIKIKPEINIYEFVDKKINIYKFGIMYPTIIELFRTFLYEISFYGPPNERQKVSDEINKRIKDFHEGKCKLYNFKTGKIVNRKGIKQNDKQTRTRQDTRNNKKPRNEIQNQKNPPKSNQKTSN